MKKNILIISIGVIIAVVLCGYFMLIDINSKISIIDSKFRLYYIYDDKNIDVILSEDEGKTVKEILNGKKTYVDAPSCGFTEKISLSVDNLIFCVACDKCPIIKIGDRYLNISEKDREIIDFIFNKYGGSFPCL